MSKTMTRPTETVAPMTIGERIAKRKCDDVLLIREVAHAEANGNRPDAARSELLIDALGRLGLSEEFYRDVVAAIQSAADMDRTAMLRSRDELQAKADENAKELKKLREQCRKVEIAGIAAANGAKTQRDLLAQLATFERANPFLFATADEAAALKAWPMTYDDAARRVDEMSLYRGSNGALPPKGV